MHIEDGVAKVCIESSSAWVSPAVPRMLNQLGAQQLPTARTSNYVARLGT
jgi:hypothetical protein